MKIVIYDDEIINLDNCIKLYVAEPEHGFKVVAIGVDGKQHDICGCTTEKEATEIMRGIIEAWKNNREWYRI